MNERVYEIGLQQESQEFLKSLQLRLGYQISIIILIVFSCMTAAYYFDSKESFITMAFGALLSLCCLIYLHFTKKFNVVFVLYSTLGVLVTSGALIFFHNTIHFVDLLWMLAAVSLAFYSIGPKLGLPLLLFSLLAIGIFVVCSLNSHIIVIEPRNWYQKWTLLLEIISGFAVNFYLFSLYINVNHLTERRMQAFNEKLIAQNKKIKLQHDEKVTLVKEVHHRVKNNLQIVVSLLRLQSMEIKNDEAREHFQEAINRIMAMALIHQKLYQNDSLSRVMFSEYTHDLIAAIIQMDSHNRSITFEVSTDIEKVGLKELIPIGLIINELVSNSLKHAFDGRDSGHLNLMVKIGPQSDRIHLEYKDNGVWKPVTDTGGFGLELIETLAAQLDGWMRLDHLDEGSVFTFCLHNSEAVERIAE